MIKLSNKALASPEEKFEEPSLEQVFSMRSKKEPGEKAISHYFNPEEPSSVKESLKEKGGLLIDFLDNYNRLQYAASGATTESIKKIKRVSDNDDPYFDKVADIFNASIKGMVKGFTKEKKYSYRDTAEAVAPDVIKWLDKHSEFEVDDRTSEEKLKDWKTVVPVLNSVKRLTSGLGRIGIKGTDVAFFAADYFGDPVYWLSLGGITPIKILQKSSSISGEALTKAATKILGEEKYSKIVEGVQDYAFKNIMPYFDHKATFEYYGKKLGKTEEELKGMGKKLEDFFDVDTIAKAESQAAGIEMQEAFKAPKSSFFRRIKMTDADDAVLGKHLADLETRASDVLGQEWSKDLGMRVEQYISSEGAAKALKSLSAATTNKEHDLALQALGEQLEIGKADFYKKFGGKVNKTNLVQALSENKGVRYIASKLAAKEKQATLRFADMNLAKSKSVYKLAKSEVRNQLSLIQSNLKKGIGDAGKLVTDQIDSTRSIFKDISLSLKEASKLSTETAYEGLKANMGRLRERVESIGSMMIADSKDTLLKSKWSGISTRLDSLESNYLKAQLEGVKEYKDEGLKLIAKEGSKLFKDLKDVGSQFSSELSKLKLGQKASLNISKEMIGEAGKSAKELLSEMNVIERNHLKEVIRHKQVYANAGRKFNALTTQYEKGLKRLLNASEVQSFYKRTKGMVDKVWEDGLKELPEELRGVAVKARAYLDEIGTKMAEADDPLIKGMTPLYFPRMEMGESVFDHVKTSVVTGASPFNSRKFRTFDEFKKHLAEKGGVPEERAIVAVMRHLERSQMKIGKKNFEEAVLKHFNIEHLDDAPAGVKKSLKALFRNDFVDPDSLIGKGLSGYSWANNKTKMMLTVANPSFTTRNVMGMPFIIAASQGMKAGLNMTNFADAVSILSGTKGRWVVNGKEIPFEAYRQAAKKNAYFASSQFFADIGKDSDKILGRGSKMNPMYWLNKAHTGARMFEDIGRNAAAIAALKKGASLDEAFEIGKKTMFNYNLKNSQVDMALQGIMGFYTFSRRNFPIQVRAMLSDPVQYATYSKIINKVSNREALSEEEIGAMNKWDRASLQVFNDAVNGVRTFTKLGFTPMEEASQTFRSLSPKEFGEYKMEMLSKASPLLISTLETLFGKPATREGEFGFKLPHEYTKLIPDRVAKMLNLTKVEDDKWVNGAKVGKEEVFYGPRTIVNLIQRFPVTSRFLGDLTYAMKMKSEGKSYSGVFTGMKEGEIDVRKAEKMRELRYRERMNEKVQERGGKLMKIPTIPKGQKRGVRLYGN